MHIAVKEIKLKINKTSKNPKMSCWVKVTSKNEEDVIIS